MAIGENKKRKRNDGSNQRIAGVSISGAIKRGSGSIISVATKNRAKEEEAAKIISVIMALGNISSISKINGNGVAKMAKRRRKYQHQRQSGGVISAASISMA